MAAPHVLALLGGAVATPAPAVDPALAAPQRQLRIADPDSRLGADWRRSADAVVTGVGDTDGYHLMIGREKDAFQWSTLATLAGPNPNGSPWTGYSCVTGSGRYAAAVYLPISRANDQRSLQAGALAAVVDTATGQARHVAADVALSYFSPACGAGDEVLLSRSLGVDEERTELLHVDAAAGRVTRTDRVGRQLTNMVPAADGTYGVVGTHLVKVARGGALSTVATLAGRPFAVVANRAGIDVLSARGDRAVAQRHAGTGIRTLGAGHLHRLQLFALGGGRSALVGETAGIRAPGLVTIPGTRPVTAVSAQAHLVVERMSSRQNDAVVRAGIGGLRPELAGRAAVTARIPATGARVEGEIAVGAPAAAPAGTRLLANVDNPICAVHRNDIRRQVLQPTAAMVEWAVDLAVKGQSRVQRPADYLRSGLPAYTPQGMFAPPTLRGGGQIPAQVVLGILAQESNFRQATWHARPGDGGNPLIGDYYGNVPAVDFIEYGNADCGYGIGQVTDGMRKNDPKYTEAQEGAIAVDYAANIAAGLQILADKWNQIHAAGLLLNGGDPRYVENWFFATWAYNSGFYPPTGQHWGVGWFNNPANPRYRANRQLFLRDSYDDAAHPGEWGYPEKILGWMETPQLTYFGQASYPRATQIFGWQVANPDLFTFCKPEINSCSQASPCPQQTSACWFKQSVSWVDCTKLCSVEKVTYPPGAPEPAMQAQYPAKCTPYGSLAVIVVDDLPDQSANVRGCAGAGRGGKFTLRTGGNQSPDAYVAQIDLHSFGAGYMGHMWFTHSYPDAQDGEGQYRNRKFQVTGTWSPDLPQDGFYKIEAHMPTHGAAAPVKYYVFPGMNDDGSQPAVQEFAVQQDASNAWKLVAPRVQLRKGARVMLGNLLPGGDGRNVVFDALAFTPVA